MANSPYQAQLKGPLSFIGDWINNSDWFPIEINVPDTFGAIGNGLQGFGNNVGNFAQGIGNNIGNFAQGVGTGFNTVTTNIGNGLQSFAQRIPIISNFVRPVAVAQNTKFGTKYFVVMPEVYNELEKGDTEEVTNDIDFDPFAEDDMLSNFP